MLRRNVCIRACAAPSWRVAELTGLLIAEYFDSPRFRADLLDGLDTLVAICVTHWRRAPHMWLAHWHTLLVERLLYRILECAVTAACVRSGAAFCRDAVAFYYLMPLVQEYRFAHCWPTRLLRAGTRVLYPAPLRRVLRYVLERPFTHVDPVAYTQQPKWHRTTTSASPPAAASRNNNTATSPSPSSSSSRDAFARVPHPFREPMRFYARSYDVHLAYAVVAAGFVPDMTQLAMDHVEWLWLFACERHKHTSRWRLAKRYVAGMSGYVVRASLHYAARMLGASVGRRLSREPTRGAVFWLESAVVAAAMLPTSALGDAVMLYVRALLERALPSTPADDEEDRREQEEQAASEAAAAAGASAAAAAAAAAGSSSSSQGHASHEHNPDYARVDYYSVLGVDAHASAEAIKRAYRQRALQCHPDRVGGEAAAKEAARVQMAAVNDAYHTLIDPDKRAVYDSARSLSGVTAVVQRVAAASPALLVLCTAGALAGMWVVSGVLICSRYAVLFRHATAPGLSSGPP